MPREPSQLQLTKEGDTIHAAATTRALSLLLPTARTARGFVYIRLLFGFVTEPTPPLVAGVETAKEHSMPELPRLACCSQVEALASSCVQLDSNSSNETTSGRKLAAPALH